MLWMLATAAALGCDSATLQEAISRAEAAFDTMDAAAFEGAADDADRSLGCMQQPLTPVQCAAFHRLRALEAFFEEDEAATILSFQSVLATQPGYQLSTAIAPVGHPLREDFEQALEYSTPETFPLDPPASGWLQVDGRRTASAPAGRPFVFQHLDAMGGVSSTAYVGAGAPVPSYPTKPEPAPAPVPTPLPEPVPVTAERSGPSPVLLGAGAALGVAAGALYGGAFASRATYDEAVAAGDAEKIRSTYITTNALTISSISAAGLGATFVVVGLL